MDLIRIPTANLLVVGRQHEIRGLLSLLTPDLKHPVVMRAPGEPLVLPSASSILGTLIIHDVGTLAAAEQLALLDWLDRPHRQARVISTATASLMTMIESGTFSDLLYYRLNTVCVCLD